MSRRLLVGLALVMPGGFAYAQAAPGTESTARPPDHISISDDPLAADTDADAEPSTGSEPVVPDAERIARIQAERIAAPSGYTTTIVDVVEPPAPLTGTPTVDRLDLFATSDVTLLEPAFHLDRGTPHESRTSSQIGGDLALGIGSERHRVGTVGSGTLAAGLRRRHVLALWRSELAGDQGGLLRGHHRGLVELRPDESSDIAGALALHGDLEHGEARGLAPVELGPGRRETASGRVDGVLRIGGRNDFTAVGTIDAELGATRWDPATAPTIASATRRAIGLGFGAAPQDGELPRGHLDFVRARVEQVELHARLPGDPNARSAGDASGIGTGGGGPADQARIVELGAGATEMTFHVDHEVLAVVDGDIGWSWIEAGRLTDNAFRMRIAGAMKWRNEGQPAVRRLGLAFARHPSVTADGSRIVGDWRAEIQYGIESKRARLGASGGISWLVPFAGPDSQPEPSHALVRYGAQLEAAAKLGIAGLELGVYHANQFEPPLAGDPWASARRWSTETGLVARVRR